MAELLQLNVTKAYGAGYMCGKGWISPEELVNVNSYFGELLAEGIRGSLKDAKSRGPAFAASLMKISAMGHADAGHDIKETKNHRTVVD